MDILVPRVIHQTYKTYDIPGAWEQSRRAWKSLHPEWTYMFWTDDMMHMHISKWHAAYYDAFLELEYPIQRVDVFRYFLMRDFGGFYCDLDIVPQQNIEKFLLPGHVFLVHSANTKTVYTNALMASSTTPEAYAFWTELINASLNFDSKSLTWHSFLSVSKHMHIMLSTGPLALTRCASETGTPLTVLPRRLWNPFDLTVAGDLATQKLNKEALMHIVEGSSWHSLDSSFISIVHEWKHFIIGFLVLLALVYVVKYLEIMNHVRILVRRFRKRPLQ